MVHVTKGGQIKPGGRWPKSEVKRARWRYQLELASEYTKALKRRDGSQGAASKGRSIEITPELRARYDTR